MQVREDPDISSYTKRDQEKAQEEALPELLKTLNPEQKKAVETTEGPLLVLAGAGTGKTRVLTTRLAWILKSGLALPGEILALTFTNKAAEEMKRRTSSLTKEATHHMPWLGTFHSIGLKIIRYHVECIKLKPDFCILDTDDQLRLTKQVIRECGLDEKICSPRLLAQKIDYWKNEALKPEDILEKEKMSLANGKAQELYHIYQNMLQKMNACDFGDLLLHPISIFSAYPEILEKYQKKFRYILVDEYQDTNLSQYMFLQLFSQGTQGKKGPNTHINICCVGDDDQSVYSWRGAKVSNILRFSKDFPSAQIIRLERNYRSTSHILGAASHLISFNTERIGKTLRTDTPSKDDEPVHIHTAPDSEQEACSITERIRSFQSRGKKLNDMAILVRASFQMREFEDFFVTRGINYRVIGGPRFYERLEIRDALSFFRIVARPTDNLAFERIINVPKRGLGQATVRHLRLIADQNKEHMFAAASRIVEASGPCPGSLKALRLLVQQLNRWQAALQSMAHTQVAEMILRESGYIGMWKNDTSANAPERTENLKELLGFLDEYESLPSFLDHVALVTDTTGSIAEHDAVSIMTLHAAKGLEFDTVFLPGWEEELFPHPRVLGENGQAGLEEERRLAYVGLTRAKKNLHIWFSSSRRTYNRSWQTATPSRFLAELPKDHIKMVRQENTARGHVPSLSSLVKRKNPGNIGESIQYSSFEQGDRVFHEKFGNGNITQIDGERLTIEFDKAGCKKIMDQFIRKI